MQTARKDPSLRTVSTEGTKATKAERRAARSRERAEAARRAARRRRLLTVGGIVLAVLALAGIGFVIAGDDPAPGTETAGTAPVEPTSPGSVEVAGPPRTEPLAPGESIPAFSAPGMDASGLDGTTVRWSDYEGAPAVLTVWAPWCPHCQVELPILDRVMDRNPDVGFVSVVTSIGDQPGPTPDGYLRDRGLSFPVAVDDVDGTLAQAFGIGGFPTIYFVASDGTVVQVAEGEVDEATLESIVTSLT